MGKKKSEVPEGCIALVGKYRYKSKNAETKQIEIETKDQRIILPQKEKVRIMALKALGFEEEK